MKARTTSTFVGGIVAEVTKINRSGVELAWGIRCTIGVAVPLAIALIAKAPAQGVAVAVGAIVVGFASRQGVYRTRAAAMLFASLGMAIATFVAGISSGRPVTDVTIAALWGYAAGLLASLGPAATAVGVNSIVALSIFSQYRMTPLDAGIQAGLVFAGGLWQTVLCVLVFPLRRFDAERTVLAAAYDGLAEYAAHLPSAKLSVPDPKPFAELAATLADPQPFARRGDIAAFEGLLIAAERLRASLATMATDRYMLDIRHAEGGQASVERLAGAAHDVLTEIARALREARAPEGADAAWQTLESAVASLEKMPANADRDVGTSLARTVDDARALVGQLRSAWIMSGAPAEGDPEPPEPAAPHHKRLRSFRPPAIGEALETLRANVSLDSAYTQHGLRMAAVLAIAQILSHFLPIDRGYWIAITAAIVLRPDFATTFTRGVARLGGTLIGALVASSVALLNPSGTALVALALFFVALAYTFFNVNYAVFSAAITGFVVFLLAFGGFSEHAAVLDRIGATLVGGVLALAAYLAWPTWERELVPARLAELLDRQRVHSRLVLQAYLDPAHRDDAAIRTAQMASWRARSNADASVDRMLSEPVPPRSVTVRAALGILAASRRYGLATLSLAARLPRAPSLPPAVTPAYSALIDGFDTSLEMLESAVRHRVDVQPIPPLRTLYAQFASVVDSDRPDTEVLLTETDLMVDSVNTIAEILHRLHRDDHGPTP